MPRTLALACLLALASGCASAAAPESPTVLRVVMADDWANAPVVTEVIDELERDHDGLRVEVQASPFSRIPDLVDASFDIEQPYDLAHWHAFAAASAGLAQPVDDLWEEHGLRAAEYLDGAVESVTWLGRPYGVPLDTNAMVLLARPAVLEEVGLGVGQLDSAHDLLDVARRVVGGGAADHAMLIGASSWTAYGWIRAFGGELVEIDQDTGEPTFSFDDPDVVAALEMRTTMVREGLAPSPFAPDLANDAVQLFAQGDVALHDGGSWDLPILERSGVDPDDVAVLPLPRGDGDTGTVLGGSSLFVPRGAEHRELAFELAVRLTADETALRLAEEEGRLPARSRVFDHELFRRSPQMAAFVEQLPDADVMPLIAYPLVSEAFREALENMLAGRQEPAEAMAEVQGFAERWLETR